MTVVELVGCPIVIPALAQDEDVVTATEGVWVDGYRAEVDIGIVACSLTAGRTVKVPLRELFDVFAGFVKSLLGEIGLAAIRDICGCWEPVERRNRTCCQALRFYPVGR